MPSLDRASASGIQASLYHLGSLPQFPLRRIRTLPFENSFGSNIVVIKHRQNMEMSMCYVEACGKHPNLLRLINDPDDGSHSPHHEHQFDERFFVQFVECLDVVSGNDEDMPDIDRMLV